MSAAFCPALRHTMTTTLPRSTPGATRAQASSAVAAFEEVAPTAARRAAISLIGASNGSGLVSEPSP